MLRRVLPAAVLVAVSWTSLHGAQREATPEADAASPTQAGAADTAQAGPADATGTGPPGTDSPGADPPGADPPDSEGDEAAADVGPPEPPPEVLEIGDGLYVLPYCGNAVARVTPHGVVLAGHRLAEHRARITQLLATVTDRRIAYELATHPGEDADATPAAPGARRIAPGRTGALASPGGLAEAPDILFNTRLSLFFGDAEITLHHVGDGPADGAAVVIFPDRGAVHAGRLVVDGAPFIDFTRGGSAEGWIESLDALLALPFDTVVPGEGGPVLQKSDALAFRDRLVTLRTRLGQLVRRGIAKEDVADHLQTGDLGWLLGLNGDFVRETLPGLYDEVAGGP